MDNKNYIQSPFSLRSLMSAVVPAYVFPTLMSFISGFLLQKNDLMVASYSSIGLSSLVSTLFSFILLWQLELRQILIYNRLVRSLLIILLMVSLGTVCISLFQLQSERFNITFSAFLGAAIVTIRYMVIKNKNENVISKDS